MPTPPTAFVTGGAHAFRANGGGEELPGKGSLASHFAWLSCRSAGIVVL